MLSALFIVGYSLSAADDTDWMMILVSMISDEGKDAASYLCLLGKGIPVSEVMDYEERVYLP